MNYRVMPKTDLLPNALYTAAQVKALDELTIEQFDLPGRVLMQRAGQAVFDLIQLRWPTARRIMVLAGAGNNAGDGFVIALLAKQAGLSVSVISMVSLEELQGDAHFYAQQWCQSGETLLALTDMPAKVDVFVDALLGIGLQRDVKGAWASLIEQVNARKTPVIAVDIPSGLNADKGTVMGVAIKADCTMSFIGLKQGLFTADAANYVGEVFFDALEVPAKVYASQILSARRIDWQKQRDLLSPRLRTAHKGHFGHVLVIGGDNGYGGAALLAATAALRCGAGLVSVVTRPEHVAAIVAARPEIMAHGIHDIDELDALLQQATVIVLGPGLGQSQWGLALWKKAIGVSRQKVIDADALNLLAMNPEQDSNWVLTPHPGEAARLLHVCNADINVDRFQVAQSISRRYGGCCVLKGAGTLVQSQENVPPAICSDGNPGMASGGVGDVLSGVIGAFLAQGYDLADAAQIGVCLHSAAADGAANKVGEASLLASDLIDQFPELLRN